MRTKQSKEPTFEMQLNILISTIDSGIDEVYKILQDKQEAVKYIISHQYTDMKFRNIPDSLIREDVIVSQIPGKGLSKSRNNAIEIADGDIALIADDDVRYLPDSFQTIAEAFKDDPDLNVACFKIKTNDGEPEYKNYPNAAYTFSKRKKHYISSIEVAIRLNSIKSKNIYFDERFGLGAKKFLSGEEEMFIIDCVKAGLSVSYFPEYIVKHPFQSSAKKSPKFDSRRISISGVLDSRRYGYLSILKAFVAAAIISPKLIRKGVNPMMYLYYRLNGSLYQLFSK